MGSQENIFAVLFESIQEGLVLVDQKGCIVKTNQTAKSMFGYKEKELVGEPVDMLVPVNDREKHKYLREPFHKAPEHRSVGVVNKLFGQRKDGSVFRVEVSLNPFKSKTGEPYVAALISDITSRIRSEEMLLQQNQELEQFAHVAAHDLKEPLRGITTYLSILQKKHGDQLSEEANSYIENAYNNASRMKQLIANILDFSKSGEVGNEQVNLNEVVDSIFSNYNNQKEQNLIKLNKTELPVLNGDLTSYNQLFSNLINNAVKYQVEGNVPEVTISAEEDESFWLINVADNGIGIDPKHEDKVFEIFKRLHSNSEYGGTGIGLATCKKIASAFDGKIWFEPNNPKGTVFKVKLPKK